MPIQYQIHLASATTYYQDQVYHIQKDKKNKAMHIFFLSAASVSLQ
jgi:hypothetical protein